MTEKARAYYNEIEPYAAEWLRNLISAGHIADGDVDTRDIRDVQPRDLYRYTQCHFFAGIGAWSYALRAARWSDARPVWTGSCPCQPFSAAGKSGGFSDERHLWPYWHHLIRVCRPSVIFGEQVASRGGLSWLDLVQSDMEGEDYAFGAADLCAAGFGAPHIRQRLLFVAAPKAITGGYEQGVQVSELGELGNSDRAGPQGRCGEPKQGAGECAFRTPSPTNSFWYDAEWLTCTDGKARPVEPGTYPLAHGAPARVGRLRAYGNTIVAPQAVKFINAVMGAIDGQH